MPYNPFGNPGYSAPYIPSGTADIAGVTWVSSINEVQSAIVPYGKQLYMDRNNDQFYVKDHTGFIKAYKFQEVPLPSNDPSNFVTKQEFDELRQKYEQLVQQQQSNTYSAKWNEPIANNAADAAIQGNSGTSEAAVLQQDSSDGTVRVSAE